MRSLPLLLTCALCVGCASSQPPPDVDRAPYNAIIVFEWLSETESEATSTIGAEEPEATVPVPTERREDSSASELTEQVSTDHQPSPRPVSRRDVEDAILAGLEDYAVFSDFQVADWATMDALSEREKADLIVLIRIGTVADWDESETSLNPGLAVLDGLLWVGTAVGGIWVPDKEFTTRSDIEISWKRPNLGGDDRTDVRDSVDTPAASTGPTTLADVRSEFGPSKERLSSRDYRLSLWERAKFWSYPLPYFVNLVVPAGLVPYQDEDEVTKSLVSAALEDIQRELAQKLTRQALGSGGAPFLFRLDQPANGVTIDANSAEVSYRYLLEAGFERHSLTGLEALYVDFKAAGEEHYERQWTYRGDQIHEINEKISNDQPIKTKISGLKSGTNLVRFQAETRIGGQHITNTVAIRRP